MKSLLRILIVVLLSAPLSACKTEEVAVVKPKPAPEKSEADARNAYAHFFAALGYERDGDANELRALRKRARESFVRALEHYEAARKLSPKSALLLKRMGLCYMKAGRFDLAGDTLAQAVRLGAGDVEARGLLAEAYFKADRLEEAARVYRDWIALNPKREATYRALAGIYKSLKRTNDAMKVLEQLAAVSPSPQAVHIEMAEMYAAQKRYDKAVFHYLLVKRKYPEYNLNLYRLVVCLEELGRLDDAVREMEALRGGDPHNRGWQLKLASLYRRAGRSEKAVSLLMGIVKASDDPLDSHVVSAYLSLAALRESENRLEWAAAILEEALAGGTRDYRISEALGDLRVRQGRWARAIRGYRNALALRPPEEAADVIREKIRKTQGHLTQP